MNRNYIKTQKTKSK